MLLRWKGFHGHCQDPSRRARAPPLTCSSPTPQPPGTWGARPRKRSRWGNRPFRGWGPRVSTPLRGSWQVGVVARHARPPPHAFRPRPGPALTYAAPGEAEDAILSCRGCSGRHRAVLAVRGAMCPWPAPPRAAPRRRTATRADGDPSRSVSTRPRAVPPAEDPPLASPAPASTRRPPGRSCSAAWSCAAAASRRVAGATRGWGRAGEAGGGLCTD